MLRQSAFTGALTDTFGLNFSFAFPSTCLLLFFKKPILTLLPICLDWFRCLLIANVKK